MYYIHTDFFRFFLKAKKHNTSVQIKDMMKIIKKISDNKIIIPTYNWDFPKTKKFNIQKDKRQEFFRNILENKKKYFELKFQ